jgi:hypothetical protein
MVCLVREVITNEPKAIHRTALDTAGHKVKIDGKDRLALGPIGGGAVKLTDDADVELALGIAEGVETALSLRLLPEFGSTAVWSVLNAGGIESFPAPPGIECLWIAVDHDPAGLKAAHLCAARWRDAERDVFLVTPKLERADLNDIAMEGRSWLRPRPTQSSTCGRIVVVAPVRAQQPPGSSLPDSPSSISTRSKSGPSRPIS